MLETLLEKIKNISIWRLSAKWAFGVLASIETIMSIALISLDFITKWWSRLFIILIAYGIITIIAFISISMKYKDNITMKIRNMPVSVKAGDIFKSDGWKVISFTEYYDTTVDDRIISRNSLNGKFIEKCVKENKFNALLQKIGDTSDETHTEYKFRMKNGRKLYPLGRIKIFEEYMLLAFTHINSSLEAHLTRAQYEQCLRVMWQEISRTYANKPIFIPLLGSGITRFDDCNIRSKQELLKCMICTLNTSNVHINQPITIVLTSDAIKEINLYELKEIFKS